MNSTDCLAEKLSNKPLQPFPPHPVAVPGYEIVPMSNDAVNLRRWNRSVVLRGQAARFIVRLIRAMDGERDASQLAATLDLDYSIVTELLARLYAAHLIVDRDDLLAATDQHFGLATLVENLARDYPATVQKGHSIYRQIQHQTVLLIGQDGLAEVVRDQIAQSGLDHELIQDLDVVESTYIEQTRPAFLIHAERMADYQSALRINELLLHVGIPWVAGWLEGTNAIVTHVMVPGENACFECLLRRQRGNYASLDQDLAYEQLLRDGRPKIPLHAQESTPGIDGILAGLLTMRAVAYMAGWRPGPPLPKLLEFSTLQLESRSHPVLRLPYCPACGPTSFQPRVQTYRDRTMPSASEVLE